MNAKFTFLILFFASGHFHAASRENIYNQAQIFNQLEILSESQKPGAAYAIRSLNPNLKLCAHQECISLGKNWQIMSTLVDGAERQSIMLWDPASGWFLSDLHLEKNIFQLRAPFKLRLPSAVRENIENKDDIVAEERRFNWNILKTVSDKPWPCQWQSPLAKTEVVSLFGSTRTVPTGETYSHKGVDLRAPRLTPVLAVADGVVMNNSNHVISGNNINIDHGQGIISRYFHLSDSDIKKDSLVKRGDVIAYSGATGRVEAPHLHLEMRVRGMPVDPLSTLRLMSRLCDQE